MTGYVVLKSLHVAAAVVSLTLFVLRGIWMVHSPERLGAGWVKVFPHVNDTVLLGAGIALAVTIGRYPFVDGWLTAKTVALIVYIGLGMVALKHGKTLRVRIFAWVAALTVFAYILAVAATRSVGPWVT
jgi:uncharacterized membrane protein SirB2